MAGEFRTLAMEQNEEFRPAFPAWLRRIDPTLAAEEHNNLYRIFRERRLAYARKRGVLRLADWVLVSGKAICSVWFLLAVLGLILFGGAGCLTLLVGLVVVPAVGVLYQRLQLSKTRMPRRVTVVFSPKFFVEKAALDLWLCGSKGSELIEAMYLEEREKKYLFDAFAYIVFALVVLVVYRVAMEPSQLIGILLGITFLWSMWGIFRDSQSRKRRQFSRRKVEPFLSMWEYGEKRGSIVGKVNYWAEVTVSFFSYIPQMFVALIGVVGARVFICDYVLSFSENSNWGLSDPVLHGELTIIFSLIALRCYSWYMTIKLMEEEEIEHRKLLARADLAFDVHMGRVVMGDSDVKRTMLHDTC